MNTTDKLSDAQGRPSHESHAAESPRSGTDRRGSQPPLSAPQEIIAACKRYTVRQAAQQYRERVGNLPLSYKVSLAAESIYAARGVCMLILVWPDAIACGFFGQDGPSDQDVIAAYHAAHVCAVFEVAP